MTEQSEVRFDSLIRVSDAGRTVEVFLWDAKTVLKLGRDPSFSPAFQREAAALLATTAIPGLAPAFHGAVTVDGRPGLLMERLGGTDLLKELEKKPWRVWSTGGELAREHARLHTISAPAGIETARDRIAYRLKSEAIPDDVRSYALTVLETVPDGQQLCHVDFHPGNLMRADGALKVIDFANACAGDPDWDVAVTLCLLELGEPPPTTPRWMRLAKKFFRRAMLASYRRRYRKIRPPNPRHALAWRTLFLAQRLDDRIPEERGRILEQLSAAQKTSLPR